MRPGSLYWNQGSFGQGVTEVIIHPQWSHHPSSMTQKENREQNSGGWPSWPRTFSLPREAELGRPTAKRRALCSGSKPSTVFPPLCSVTRSLSAADLGLRLKELTVWNCWGQNKMDPTSQSYGWSFLGVSGNKGTGETKRRETFWKGSYCQRTLKTM